MVAQFQMILQGCGNFDSKFHLLCDSNLHLILSGVFFFFFFCGMGEGEVQLPCYIILLFEFKRID